MISEMLWNICPHAEQSALTSLTEYMRYCFANGIEDGPALEGARDGLPLRVEGNLAIVPLMGVMARRVGPLGKLFGLTGTDSTRLAIESAIADPDIENILLRVDSVGGSVSGLSELGDVVAKSEKPITVQTEGVAASAAYYVASQASSISVGKTDLVGSIGTRMLLYDFSRAFEDEGVEPVVIDSGEFKSAGAVGTRITPNQRADFQRIVDFYFEDFKRAVSEGRGMSPEATGSVSDGRMFTPQEAIGAGLVDDVSTLEETLGRLRQVSGRSTQSSRARLAL